MLVNFTGEKEHVEWSKIKTLDPHHRGVGIYSHERRKIMAKKKKAQKTFQEIVRDLQTRKYALGDISRFERGDVMDLSPLGIKTLGDLIEVMADPAWVWPTSVGEKQEDRVTSAALFATAEACGGNLPKELADHWEIPEGLTPRKGEASKDNGNTVVVVDTTQPEKKSGLSPFWKGFFGISEEKNEK